MGQSIIFVGGANLNRNSDNQSMYQNGYRNRYRNIRTPSRDQFYKELCEECRTFPGKKKRNRRISWLRSKYQGSTCSESAMEKVFISYLECFGRKMGHLEYRKKVIELPAFLERNKVDRRIIKRIEVIERLEPASKEKKKVKKNKVTIGKPIILTDKNKSIIQSHVVPRKMTDDERKKRIRNFYKLLHEYLIETISNPRAIMTQELADECMYFMRHFKYIDGLKKVYNDTLKNNLSLLEACNKNDFTMFKKDRNNLQQLIYNYRKH